MKRVFGAAVAAGLMLSATPAFAWADGWSYRAKVTVSPGQAGVSGEIGTQAVLVRLHSGNFTFSDAKPDGSDLRFFAGDDKTPLKFQIEKWDAQGEVGLVWVQVPSVGATPVPVYVYYGNPKAGPAGDAKGVFGGSAVAWHFNDDGAPQDASGHTITGSTGALRDPNGLIGPALKLDGKTGVTVPQAAFAGTAGSVSFWVKADAPGAGGTLLGVPGSVTLSLVAGVPTLEVGSQKIAAAAALGGDGWTHLAVVGDGSKVMLYVNGAAAGSIAAALPAATGPGVLGQGFAGDLDEFEVVPSALSAGAVALAANSQGSGAKLLTFDKPEQVDAGGHGYFGILLAALTPDAWAVIGILGIMSLISWVVMISKGLMLGRVASANDAFLDDYEKAAEARGAHDGLPDVTAGRESSSLAHLYRIGQRELSRRLAEGRTSGSRFAIRAQSIAAIRSALDAGQAREGQRLNKWMVLLTIAISGGPFLGLLGTVVGVMITFAAVAAAGDVNINAIAPGIAAALLATVAGLAVAIPALFGYNYLLSRVEEIDTDNRIFVDELEKRIAETYQDVAGTGGSGGPGGGDMGPAGRPGGQDNQHTGPLPVAAE